MEISETSRLQMMRRFPSVKYMELGARKRIPDFVWDYLMGGAGDETGLERNRGAYNRIEFIPEYLKEQRPAKLDVGIFGVSYSMPFGVAPVGLSGLIWPRAAEFLAQAAREANIPFCLSSLATSKLEVIAELAGSNAWFQLYPTRDENIEKDLIRRVREAKFSTLVVTVDTQTTSRRVKSIRNGLSIPPRLTPRTAASILLNPAWALSTLRSGKPKFEVMEPYFPPAANYRSVAQMATTLLSRALDPQRIKALRQLWDGPLLIKGPISAQDAGFCKSMGADGIILSNHGGRQLEAIAPPIEMLPMVRDAVGADFPLFVDSGVRSGLDIARALARGANFVLLGRVFYLAIAALGMNGARHAIDLLAIELRQAMEQIGCAEISELSGRLTEGLIGSRTGVA